MSNIPIIDEIQGSGTIAFTQDGMSATRICRCNGSKVFEAITWLMGIPVIFGDFMLMVGRQTYPGIPYLWVDSVTVEPLGTMLNSNWYDGPAYKEAKLTVQYKTPEGEDNQNQNGNGEGIQYLIESLDYSVEIAIVPVEVVDKVDVAKEQKNAADAFAAAQAADPGGNTSAIAQAVQAQAAANAVPKKRTVKRHIRLPTITYEITLPRIRNPPFDTIREMVGDINSKTIFGAEKGTVLFDGPKGDRESSFMQYRFWKLQYKFIYNKHGWNFVLHPETLKWVRATAVGFDNDAYEYSDLRKLIPPPYQVS